MMSKLEKAGLRGCFNDTGVSSMFNFHNCLLLDNLKDMKFLSDRISPQRRVELFVDLDAQIIYSKGDEELDRAIDILRVSLAHVIKSFEEEYDFFEPQLVIKMDSKVGFVLFMNRKEDEC